MKSTSARITGRAVALLSVFGLFFATGAAATATPAKPPKPPVEKVAVCVYDDATSEWELASIKTSVVDKLVARGEAAYPLEPVPGTDGTYVFDAACVPQPVTPVEKIFAVAYTDQDTSDGGYNADVDVLIAKLVDGNSDGILNAGDKVITDQYPKFWDALEFGDFNVTEHVITDIDGCDAYLCEVSMAVPIGDVTSYWGFGFHHYAGVSEGYLESIPFAATTNIQDNLGSAYGYLDIYSGSPSQPTDTIAGGYQSGYPEDDAFVDVDIY